MANSDKNIVITPNIGSSSDDPKIVFTGANTAGSYPVTLRAYPTSNGTLSIEGSAGQLFSVTNSLTGTIYSVNDISGMPSIEVLDSGLVKFAQYSGNVLIGTATSDGSAKLQVSTFSRFGNIYVGYGTYKNSIRPVDDNNINLDTPSGYTASATSLRAPIFYDYDDTGYYVDPRSGSRMSGLRLDGVDNNASGDDAILWINKPNNNDWSIIVTGALEYGLDLRMATSHSYAIRTLANGNEYARWGSDYIYHSSSIRAPIFYDTNDTGYYLDPHSTSRLYQINYNSLYYANDTNYGLIGANIYVDTVNSGASGDQLELNYVRGTYVSISHDSMRAPLFYDYNDTTYYSDPAGVSNFNNLTLGNYSTNQSYPGILILGNASYDYVFTNGSWSGSITAGILANCNNYWEMAIHDSGTRVVSPFMYHPDNYILMGRDIGWGTTFIAAASSFRAPIFYDNNDTGYYLDPNSYSYVYSLRAASYLASSGNIYTDANYGYGLVGTYASTRYQGVFAMGDSYKLPADGTTTGSLYGIAWSHPNAGGAAGNLNSHGALFLQNGSFMAAISTNGTFSAEVRGTIFYDYNDPSYFLNPNGTSQLNYVLANDWFRPQGGTGVYWQDYGRGIRASDNEYSYGNIGTYGSGLNGWRGYGVYPNNCILMSNGSTHGLYNASSGVWIMQTSDAVGSNMTFYGNVTAYSDLRLKNNVREIDNVLERRNGLALSAIKYERNDRTRIGYGAQTLRDNGCSEFVHEADDNMKIATGLGTLSVDYGETTAVLAVASKMTDDKVALLEERIKTLEQIIAKLIGE